MKSPTFRSLAMDLTCLFIAIGISFPFCENLKSQGLPAPQLVIIFLSDILLSVVVKVSVICQILDEQYLKNKKP